MLRYPTLTAGLIAGFAICLFPERFAENPTHFGPSAAEQGAVVNKEETTRVSCRDDGLVEKCSEMVVGCFQIMLNSTLTMRLHTRTETHSHNPVVSIINKLNILLLSC